jgi:hypothetical protein
MPILGILASSMRGSTNSYESIATTTVGSGGQSTITFSSIPSTYKHLQIRFLTRSASSFTQVGMKINSDTGANYAAHQLTGNGSSATAAAGSSVSGPVTVPIRVPDTASIFGGAVMDVLDYANTSKYKTFRTLSGADLNGSGQIILASTLWMNSNAITQIDFTTSDGFNFAQYSQIALYGIKG